MDKNLINQVIERLKPLNPEKIILFGSYAYGSPDKESDIDLMVILKDNFIPEDFNENMNLYLKVSSRIRDLKKKIPIDLVVYTKAMYERFIELGSSFSREILSKGVNLI
jgi:predicted nucleotidyltransferase